MAVPPLPAALAYLWQRFIDMSGRRQSTGFGPARLSYLEIDAYQRVTGFRFQPWEVRLIERLDDAWMIANSPKKDANGN